MCNPGLRCMYCKSWVRWESTEMVRRYAHLSSEHLAQYVERFSPLRVVAREGATNWLRSAEAKAAEAS